MTDRFVASVPIRWSPTAERIALARLETAHRLRNEVLAEYQRRANASLRDPDLARLRAELRVAKREGRAAGVVHRDSTPVPAAVVPRVFEFASAKERGAAWSALRQRHGLIGKLPVSALTDEGAQWYARTNAFAKALTARQKAHGPAGLDAASIHHEIVAGQRDRVLAWLMPSKEQGRLGRPRFAAFRDGLRAFTGSSSAKNDGGLSVDVSAATLLWKGAGGKHPILARLRLDNDPWLAKALALPIAQLRVLYRDRGRKRRWFLQVVLVGTPPVNPRLRNAIAARPAAAVGVDVGSRHIAAVGERFALLADLAPTMLAREVARDAGLALADVRDGDRRKRDRWCRRLARRISRTVARNPANAHALRTRKKALTRTRDGVAVGKVVDLPAGYAKGTRLVRSAHVLAMCHRLADVAAADALARDNDHGRLANVVHTLGSRIALEDLSYVAWQRVFGRQVRRFAPGGFVARLRRRASIFGTDLVDVSTTATKLSQLCHGCGSFESAPIRGAIADRMKPSCPVCARPAVHRDLYSAFLAQHASESSVDLHAAQAAWTRAFELVDGARQTYDTAEGTRFARAPRATGHGPSFRAVAPQAPSVGLAPALTVTPTRFAPAPVRDGSSPRMNGRDSHAGRVAVTPYDRANASRRASPQPLPPAPAERGRVRADPLENVHATRNPVRDG